MSAPTGILFNNPIVAPISASSLIQPAAYAYFYTTGTTSPVAVYADGGLTTPLSQPVTANSAGYFPAIYLNPATTYRVQLYTSANVLISDTDPYVVPGVAITQAEVGALLYPQTSAESSASITPVNYSYAPGVVDRYGTNTTPGTTDMTVAFTNAAAQAAQGGAGIVFLGAEYLTVSGFVVNANGVSVQGAGMGLTKLLAGAGSIAVLKLCQDNIVVEDLLIDGNGQTSVDGLVFAPANEAITNATNQNSYCNIRSIQIQNCNNGLRMRPGPTVSAVDSGCFYNVFSGLYALNCVRGIWMQNAVNNGRAGANRCTFVGVRIGSSSTVCNTGLQIDNATTVQFFGMHCEGIANGSSPNTTPTAVQIANANSGGEDNDNNQFFGCFMEANTRDLDNSNAFTEIFGGYWTASKFGGGGVNPQTMIGGDPGQMPFIIPALQHGEGVTGFPSGFLGITEEVADYSGSTYYNWQSYALSTGNVTNAASISGATSNFRKASSMVEWVVTFEFIASVAGTAITITPPIAPNSLYTTSFTNNLFYSATVTGASATPTVVAAGWTSGGKLYFPPPSGNWSTSGNNSIQFQVPAYHT